MKYIWPEVEGAGATDPKVCLDWALLEALFSRLAFTDAVVMSIGRICGYNCCLLVEC
jgi:hypothetical protein